MIALIVGATNQVFGVLLPSPSQLPVQVSRILLGALTAVVAYLLLLWWSKRKSLTVIATGLLMITVGWFVARMHLWFFDRLYRSAGAVSRSDGTTAL